jgi:hypothetical protein
MLHQFASIVTNPGQDKGRTRLEKALSHLGQSITTEHVWTKMFPVGEGQGERGAGCGHHRGFVARLRAPLTTIAARAV